MKAKDLLKLIPAKVRITKDIEYEVLYVDSFPNDLTQLGESRYTPFRQILIRNGQTPAETYKTYLHEVLHVFAFEYKGLILTEKQVLILERCMFNFLKLNGILENLIDNLKEKE